MVGIEEFIRDPTPYRSYFVLHGLAGTGKTFCMALLAARYRDASLAAFTGKAASVLRARTSAGSRVSTLHSLLFDFRGLAEADDRNRRDPIFVAKGVELPQRVILVDECSSIGERMASDLLATGARVVACGDPGQLPPVKDAQFFTDPDDTLEVIHRQALDSAIIRQAHRVRNEGCYEADGDDFRVIPFADTFELLDHDVLLCWRNATRKKLNDKKRAALRIDGSLRAGEPVMCLRNNHRLGLYNGAIYELARDRDPDDPGSVVYGDDATVGRRPRIDVELMTVEGDPEFIEKQYDDSWMPFALAYASTVHKFQGSESPKVLLFDECTQNRIPFLYTGITRAAKSCTVVKWR